ncbi:MAG: hypothetical protein HPY59_13340 [Anaerolineae bacterium]|nr:hypothetical protein [Anaerolineae bacterium]
MPEVRVFVRVLTLGAATAAALLFSAPVYAQDEATQDTPAAEEIIVEETAGGPAALELQPPEPAPGEEDQGSEAPEPAAAPDNALLFVRGGRVAAH